MLDSFLRDRSACTRRCSRCSVVRRDNGFHKHCIRRWCLLSLPGVQQVHPGGSSMPVADIWSSNNEPCSEGRILPGSIHKASSQHRRVRGSCRLLRSLLPCKWAEVSQCRMQSSAVVPTFDPLEYCCSCKRPRGESASIHEFFLQSGKEALGNGVVVTGRLAADRTRYAQRNARLCEISARVLTALVRVEDNIVHLVPATCLHCHFQCVLDEFRAHVVGHCIANDPS